MSRFVSIADSTFAAASVGSMCGAWFSTLLASSVRAGARLVRVLMLAWLRAVLASAERAGARLARLRARLASSDRIGERVVSTWLGSRSVTVCRIYDQSHESICAV